MMYPTFWPGASVFPEGDGGCLTVWKSVVLYTSTSVSPGSSVLASAVDFTSNTLLRISRWMSEHFQE